MKCSSQPLDLLAGSPAQLREDKKTDSAINANAMRTCANYVGISAFVWLQAT